MKLRINVEFNDNYIEFYWKLPKKLFSIDSNKYINLQRVPIYECDIADFDLNKLNSNIDASLAEIKNTFNNIDFTGYSFITYDDPKNNKNIYNFIKQAKDLDISIFATNFNDIINNLGNEGYPNLKVIFENSSDKLPYQEFYDMYMKLNKTVKFVDQFALSPLEKVLLVYDIVKANEYKEEDQNESGSKSRNLNEIINGDKIVCVGFSNLMDFLLTNLGFNCGIIDLDYPDKGVSHQRNYIELKDKKYNISGLYFLDATWDSKRKDDYLDNYKYFLKSLHLFKLFKPNEYVRTNSFFRTMQNAFYDEKSIIDYLDTLDEDDLIFMRIDIDAMFDRKKKPYNPKETKKDIINDIADFIKDIYLNNNYKISKETFKNALYKVRRIEYIYKIIDFIPDEKYIDSVYQKYFKTSEDVEKLRELGRENEMKLAKIFGDFSPTTFEKDLGEIKSNSIEEDLLRAKLLRTLKSRLNEEPESEYVRKM